MIFQEGSIGSNLGNKILEIDNKTVGAVAISA
jgi:hypothetical protein